MSKSCSRSCRFHQSLDLELDLELHNLDLDLVLDCQDLDLNLVLEHKFLDLYLNFVNGKAVLYIHVGAVVHSTTFDRWATVRQQQQFKALSPFLESLFAVPATSAPVERVFSHGGLFMRPHRARMNDQLLSDLVFIKCNKLNC